jgi:hypothetical protein
MLVTHWSSARLDWDMQPNIDLVRQSDAPKAYLLEIAREVMAGGADSDRLIEALQRWSGDTMIPKVNAQPVKLFEAGGVSWTSLARGHTDARGSRSILQGLQRVGSNFLPLGTPIHLGLYRAQPLACSPSKGHLGFSTAEEPDGGICSA